MIIELSNKIKKKLEMEIRKSRINFLNNSNK